MKKSSLNGVFRRAWLKETKVMKKKKKLTTPPTLQDIKAEMELSGACEDIEMLKLLNILLILPVGTASVECSFSQMKLVKTNRISDVNLAKLLHIAIERP